MKKLKNLLKPAFVIAVVSFQCALLEAQKIDTIPCVFMYCDTFEYAGYWNADTVSRKANPEVKWMKGYNVVVNKTFTYTKYQEHLEYLDNKKQKLSKSIMVWIAVSH